MQVELLSTTNLSLLRGIRSTLSQSDSALLCVAFVHERGLHLLKRELEDQQRRGAQTRLLVTTVFDRDPAPALGLARSLGCDVRVLNLGGGTYHPKLYLGRTGDTAQAVIGSANLTAGLVGNVEVAAGLKGHPSDEPLRQAWDWAETLWKDSRASPWDLQLAAQSQDETFTPDLLRLLEQETRRDPVFHTLGARPARNEVKDLHFTGLLMETARTKRIGQAGAVIPAWMFNLAWSFLKAHGSLTNHQLLNELRVHRSSAVCAVLARLPGIEVVPGTNICLRWAHQESP